MTALGQAIGRKDFLCACDRLSKDSKNVPVKFKKILFSHS